jgi:excisionase family DNA binding protein
LNDEPTLSIKEASHILGVSAVTLRHWTDEGKIPAFITPGGHRRYSLAILKKFIRKYNHKSSFLKELSGSLKDTRSIHREIAAHFFKTNSPDGKISSVAKENFASLSRLFFNLIIKCVTEKPKQKENLDLIKEAGYQFGEMAARYGLGLTETINAFVQHRNLIIDATVKILVKNEGAHVRIGRIISMVNQILDDALVSLVIGYQKHGKVNAIMDGTA